MAVQRLEERFQFEREIWRVRNGSSIITLIKHDKDENFTKFIFGEGFGRMTHIVPSEALWLTLEFCPEKLELIGVEN
ncbi:hypothetical protein K6V78_09835 [Streptococcus gallolyticus]|nr:hypothetical protein [Streptococcus gallolyticus]MBY5041798.1 hypothetical protein [Streptococcus gallolyticus]